jgi:argonaute-like protein implicated in RNA metabolism and viral defense
MRFFERFKIVDFKFNFKNGIATDAYRIVKLGPLSKTPLYKNATVGVDQYRLLLILYKEESKIEERVKQFIKDLKEGLVDKRIFLGFNQVLETNVEIEALPFKAYDPDIIFDTFNQHVDSHVAFPVIILPKVAKSQYDSIYYRTKAVFLAKDIPTQVVTIDLLEDLNNYKWSILPLTVQIFVKMGGVPYALARRFISTDILTDVTINILGFGLSYHPLHEERGVGFITVFDHNGVWNFMDSIALSMDKIDDLKENIAKLIERSIEVILQSTTTKNQILIIHYSGKEISSKEEEAIRNAITTAKYLNKFIAVNVLKIKDSDIVVGFEDSPHKDKSGKYTWYPPAGIIFSLKRDVYLMVTTGYFESGKGIMSNIKRGLPSSKIIARHREMEIQDQSKSLLEDKDLLASVFAMCRLNYASMSNPLSKDPVTIRYSREIAWLTLRLEEHGTDLSKLTKIKNIMWFI